MYINIIICDDPFITSIKQLNKLKDEVGMAGSKSVQTTFVGITKSTIATSLRLFIMHYWLLLLPMHIAILKKQA